MRADTRDAYLHRLGVEAEPPSASALRRLHRAQVERVPYETFWLHLGEGWDIDPAGSAERVAHGRRGGYCYHVNGALSELLDDLGYRVTCHVGGVHGPDGPAAAHLTNHLVLLVHDLPDDANPGGTWYVDAGLGDGLHDPLALVAGEHRQGPLRFALQATDDGVGDWHLTHDPGGSFSGMSFRLAPVAMDVFAERHRFLSTSPDSPFASVVTAQRRHAGGVEILRGCVLTGTGEPDRTFEDRASWLAAIEDRFDLPLGGDPRIEALWRATRRTHEAWLARRERDGRATGPLAAAPSAGASAAGRAGQGCDGAGGASGTSKNRSSA